MSNYIKVTLPGFEPAVVLATTKLFFLKQGASVDENPTEEEISRFFPNAKIEAKGETPKKRNTKK